MVGAWMADRYRTKKIAFVTQPPTTTPVDPPVNTAQPIIIGNTFAVGEQLIGNNGSWTGSPTYSRTWHRDGAVIAGATTPGYTLVEADVGAMINTTIFATNAGGSSSAVSDEVGPVIEAAP